MKLKIDKSLGIKILEGRTISHQSRQAFVFRRDVICMFTCFNFDLKCSKAIEIKKTKKLLKEIYDGFFEVDRRLAIKIV